VAADGHSYERAHITTWLETNDSSPITNLQLEHKQLIPNITLKSTILSHMENLKLTEMNKHRRSSRRRRQYGEHHRHKRSDSVASIVSLSEYVMTDTRASNNRKSNTTSHDVGDTQTPAQSWKNGEKYDGDWKEGQRHGYGIFNFANGNK
jgi:hypothetical protein